MTLFIILASIKSVLLGAVWGRIDGGGIIKMHEQLERALILFFFVLACAPFAGYWAFFAYAGMVGIATGHGQYFLNRAVKYLGDKSDKEIESYERTSFLLRPFFGQDPRIDKKFAAFSGDELRHELTAAMNKYGMTKLYWRNVGGMFITGSLLGLPSSVIALCFGQYLFASIFALTGLCKATAYIIGDAYNGSTEPAEYINGGLRTSLCVAVIILYL